MPIVELVAKKTLERHPDIGLSVVDLIVLLWMYSNPYSTSRRQLSSIKYILRMSETLQTPDGTLGITDDELTQLVLGSLQRVKQKGFVYIQSAGIHYVKGTLTQKGETLVDDTITGSALKRVILEFGNNP
ncbi:MAG: hypothetical protein RTU30_08985 [Candidatus Thorarchaeota archaeon]